MRSLSVSHTHMHIYTLPQRGEMGKTVYAWGRGKDWDKEEEK